MAILGFIVVGLLLAAVFLMPKPQLQNAKAAELNEFNFPRATEGSYNFV